MKSFSNLDKTHVVGKVWNSRFHIWIFVLWRLYGQKYIHFWQANASTRFRTGWVSLV